MFQCFESVYSSEMLESLLNPIWLVYGILEVPVELLKSTTRFVMALFYHLSLLFWNFYMKLHEKSNHVLISSSGRNPVMEKMLEESIEPTEPPSLNVEINYLSGDDDDFYFLEANTKFYLTIFIILVALYGILRFLNFVLKRAFRFLRCNDDVERSTCCICQTNVSNILLLPCKHLCLCKDCFENVRTNQADTNQSHHCPMCRTHVENYWRIYN